MRGGPAAAVPHGCLLEVWDLEQVRARLPAADQPCSFPALAGLCRWFATYERSVATGVGTVHRSARPGHPPGPPPTAPASLEADWTRLRHHLVATCDD